MQARANARRVIERRSNVLRVDFGFEPDPPAPRFPGAAGLRPPDVEPPADAMGVGR